MIGYRAYLSIGLALLAISFSSVRAVETGRNLNPPRPSTQQAVSRLYIHNTEVHQRDFVDGFKNAFRQTFNVQNAQISILYPEPMTREQVASAILQESSTRRFLNLGSVVGVEGSMMLALPLDNSNGMGNAFALLSAHKPYHTHPFDQGPHLYIRAFAKVSNIDPPRSMREAQHRLDAVQSARVSIAEVVQRLSVLHRA